MDFLGLEIGRGVTLALVYLQQGARGKPEAFLCCSATVNISVDSNCTIYFIGNDLRRDLS